MEPTPREPTPDHRWSGWPGAWCLDCGQEDQREICLAVHTTIITCRQGHVQCEEWEAHGGMQECPEHRNPPCSEPGSNRHNPYTKP